MKATEFDARFERDEEITDALDITKATRPGIEMQRVDFDMPVWMLEELDQEADRIGVTRQSIVKIWISEKLESRRNATA